MVVKTVCILIQETAAVVWYPIQLRIMLRSQMGTFPPLRMYAGVCFFSIFRLNMSLRVSQPRKNISSARETNENPQSMDNQPPIVPKTKKIQLFIFIE